MIKVPDLPHSDFDEGRDISLPGGTLGALLTWMEDDGWCQVITHTSKSDTDWHWLLVIRSPLTC